MTWHQGVLTLDDHDPEAERTLAAIGGETPECLWLLHAWQSAWDYPHAAVALLGPRGMDVEFPRHRRANLAHAAKLVSPVAKGSLRALLDRFERQAVVASLPDELRTVLALDLTRRSDALTWRPSADYRTDRPQSELKLYEISTRRLRSVAEKSLRLHTDIVPREVHWACYVVPPRSGAWMTGWVSGDGCLVACGFLPHSWLRVPGAEVTETALVVAPDEGAEALVINWRRSGSGVRIESSAGRARRTASGAWSLETA
ncbi:MAG TPA: hypothetical protein VNE62_04805 [Actinomycetota bacterium]|nr:hypothetical protein [Actinomycetota bacterium]